MEKKERALKIALIAAVLVFILLIFYTNLFHYNYKMNADILSLKYLKSNSKNTF